MKPKSITLNDLTFDVRTTGNIEDDLIIFLHGFPETSIMWVQLMQDTAEKGFFCVAPNQRGYSINACPRGKKNYRFEHLVKDILDLAKHFGKDKFHLVGHDWGALIGWELVGNFPEHVISYTALSVPHPVAFTEALNTDEDQKKKSRYIKLFMIPFLPEMKIRKNNFEQFRKIWRNSSQEEVEDYLSVFKHKKSVTAALNYYRANLGGDRPAPLDAIYTPTLFLWGKKERFIGETAADLCKNHISGDFVYKKLDGGHWLMQTNYEDVKKAFFKHLESYS